MVSRRGFGVISLLAMIGFIWGLAGLLETSTAFSTAMGDASASWPEERVPGLPDVAEFSHPGWNRGHVVQAAVALSLLPYPDLPVPRLAEDEVRARSLGAMHGGLPSVRSLVRGRPVAEPPAWFILLVAAGGLLARRRSLHA